MSKKVKQNGLRRVRQDYLRLRASMDARRRAKIDETIVAFRGETDRETTVKLAAEIVRLNRNVATLKEGVDQIIDGTEFILMPKGPFAGKYRAEERRRDRSAKWI